MNTSNFIEMLRADIKRELRVEIKEELKTELLEELRKVILDELQPVTNKQVFNTQEAAAYIKVSKTTLWKLIGQNKLAYFKNGRRVFFKKYDLDQYLTKLSH